MPKYTQIAKNYVQTMRTDTYTLGLLLPVLYCRMLIAYSNNVHSTVYPT